MYTPHRAVYELRFFFSRGRKRPEGGDVPLLLCWPAQGEKAHRRGGSQASLWTDDYLAAELQRQGIKVTRRNSGQIPRKTCTFQAPISAASGDLYADGT